MNRNRTKDTKTGRFLRTRFPWTPENWDDGVMVKSRFAVYRPDCPRCYANGYALRAHVVWWLNTGFCHPKTHDLHHKDEDKLNDNFSNLEVLSKSEHRKKHQKKTFKTITCEHCGNPFQYDAARDSDRITKFCSQKCYQAHPKSQESIAKRIKSNTGKKRHPSFGLMKKAYWAAWRLKNK